MCRPYARVEDIPAGFRAFVDRRAAGRRLADRLESYRGHDVLVLGIPRGGVAVAAEIARSLGADLDVVVARKVGSPIQPELALGAVTADGARFLNPALARELGVEAGDVRSCTVQSPLEFVLFTQELVPLGEKVLVLLAQTVPIVFDPGAIRLS